MSIRSKIINKDGSINDERLYVELLREIDKNGGEIASFDLMEKMGDVSLVYPHIEDMFELNLIKKGSLPHNEGIAVSYIIPQESASDIKELIKSYDTIYEFWKKIDNKNNS